MNILDLIVRETGYNFRRETSKEFGGPCPFCRTGDDRFNIWPAEGRYWCRVCGKSGDAIQFLREYRQLSFREAVEALERAGMQPRSTSSTLAQHQAAQTVRSVSTHAVAAPNDKWRQRGWKFVVDCQHRLMETNENPRARHWLNEVRMLTDEIIWQSGIGYWPEDRYDDQHHWGLDDRTKPVWIPRGITIPWVLDGQLWGIRIRRPSGEPKYYWIPGGTASALYGADMVSEDKAAVLVEGEFDALTIRQCASDIVSTVATGSTMGARRIKWLARLSQAPIVLVAFDSDAVGDEASRYWLDAVEYAYRWRPYWDDPNGLATDGANVRSWIQQGLSHYARAFRDSDA